MVTENKPRKDGDFMGVMGWFIMIASHIASYNLVKCWGWKLYNYITIVLL
jgi:hypothetical protein